MIEAEDFAMSSILFLLNKQMDVAIKAVATLCSLREQQSFILIDLDIIITGLLHHLSQQKELFDAGTCLAYQTACDWFGQEVLKKREMMKGNLEKMPDNVKRLLKVPGYDN